MRKRLTDLDNCGIEQVVQPTTRLQVFDVRTGTGI